MKQLSAIAIVLFSLSGCTGYRLGSTLPADIKTIYVPTFVNKCGEPNLEGTATQAVLEELQKDGTLRIANRGKASEADLRMFFDAGYTDAQALEVILGLAIKLISNYTNSIAGTPLDPEAEHLRWEKPLIRERSNTHLRSVAV